MTGISWYRRAVIDELLRRKNTRTKLVHRASERPRVAPFDLRDAVWGRVETASANAPVATAAIKQSLSPDDIPGHIALIPDGNRRWARKRGYRVGKGYAAGADRITEFRKWAMVDNDVDHLTVFLLSTENILRRPEDELAQLFEVFIEFFRGVADTDLVHEHRIRHQIRGHDEFFPKLPERVRTAMDTMEAATADYDEKVLTFLVPYGGRRELVEAADEYRGRPGGQYVTDDGELNEDPFRDNLLLHDLPDVDLLVRTTEKRLSNFLLWHLAYSEFVFDMKPWPSFTEADFYEALYAYANRERRFGV